MPFIATEEVKEIRTALKKALPGYKLSVRQEHHTSLHVSILAGPADMGESCQIAPFHLNHYQGEARKVLDTVFATINAVKPKHTVSEDGDYGSIPNYYQNVEIGKWNKPYERTLERKRA